MAMAAAGMRGELVAPVMGGFGMAFKTDALWVATSNAGLDGPAGSLAATRAVVTRLRAGLEASRGYDFRSGLSLQPSLEVGLRQDDGNAETGAGVDVAGGLIFSIPSRGIKADLRVRTLLMHQDQDYRERGVLVSFSYDPKPSTAAGHDGAVGAVMGRTGQERRRGALEPGDDGGVGRTTPGSRRPVRYRARLRTSGRRTAGRDTFVRYQDFRDIALLPTGLQVGRVTAQYYELRAGCCRPAPGKPRPWNSGQRSDRPSHDDLVSIALQVVADSRCWWTVQEYSSPAAC